MENIENKKKVMVQFEFPNMSSNQFDQIWQDLRAAGYENPKGLLHHAAAPTDTGLKVVDVWENADKFNEFGQTLMPILDKNGIQGIQPVILPLHYEYSGIEKPIM
jgi:hypothetical protein